MTPERFNACLLALGWSQRQLADLLGLAPSTPAHWSSGRTRVDARVAAWLEALVAARLTVPALPEGWSRKPPATRRVFASA